VTAIGVVTGLAAEAAVARRAGLAAEACGADPDRAGDVARGFADAGVRALVSFGTAGGLDPALEAGDVVLACEVAAPGGPFAARPGWRDRLLRRLPRARPGIVAGIDAIAATPAAKRALLDSTGAAAADMESHRVAAVACERGLAFLAVRAVADAADRALPAAAARAVRADGRVSVHAGLALLVRSPGTVPDLVRAGFAMRRALAALAPAAAALADEPWEDTP